MDSGGNLEQGGASWPRRLLIGALIVLTVLLLWLAGRRLLLGGDHFTIERTRPRVSAVDGIPYRVHDVHKEPQRAADMLARLNGRVVAVLRRLRNRYVRGPDGERYPARRAAALRLLARYNPDNLAENSPRDPSGDTAYSLDKGAIVAICLRERGSPENEIHELETLTFVTLHEMTHIAIDELDHPKVFWETFRFLLEEAEEAGIFTSPDYSQSAARYCGMDINYNPRYDAGTRPV
jgi:hypothetical protein